MKNQIIVQLIIASVFVVHSFAIAQKKEVKNISKETSVRTAMSVKSAKVDTKFAPKGIFALSRLDKPLDSKTWEVSCVDGVTIRTYWYEFNPAEGVYNWAPLDSVFALANQYSKKVQLVMIPGFFSPQWVFDNLKKAEKDSFFVPHGKFQGKKMPMPLPWSTTYLNYWFTFIDTLGKKYGPESVLSLINMNGPNSHNGEVNLPHKTKHGDSTEVWKDLVLPNWRNLPNGAAKAENKLKNKMLAAYESTIACFYEAFAKKHKKYLSLQIFNQSLPVPREGKYPSALQKEFQRELIQLARDKLDKHFVLMNGGLEAWPITDQVSKLYPPPEEPMQWKRIRRLSNEGFVTGLLQKDAVDESDVTDANVKTSERELFRLIIKNGIFFGADFLVIFEKDILDEKLQNLIAAGSLVLRGKKCMCE